MSMKASVEQEYQADGLRNGREALLEMRTLVLTWEVIDRRCQRPTEEDGRAHQHKPQIRSPDSSNRHRDESRRGPTRCPTSARV